MHYARFAVLFLLLFSLGAAAQPFPSKQLRLVCPFPPGGSADVVARLAAQRLGEVLGQSVLVENRAGAGGVVGSDHVAKQAPDGHTMILVTGAYPVTAAIRKEMPFDPLKDIAMVSMLTSYPFVVSVVPGSPFKSLGDLVAHAKANPGKLNYASAGVGSVHHLSGELFNALAGTDITHIPFKGGNAPLTETLAGRSDVLFEAMTLSIGQIRAGKLRPLAVTSREPWKALPDTPPAARTLPGFEVISFIGLGVTGGTPAPVLEQLNAAVRKALDDADTQRRFVELGGEPQATSAQEMASFIDAEIGKWRKVIDLRKIERQ
ncbi:MAG TPA: tripartite tricarboxylate transporter substrate binding protein [Burkholderiales bacterium]|nr:tripartite tricarboxylate transporter substrate binding protein [Burkholderiales bacterium]